MTSAVRPMVMMVTDRRRIAAAARSDAEAADATIRAAGRAARAGATMIQVRERGLDDRSLFTLCSRIVDEVSGTSAAIVVNDRADVAGAAGAAGVHLPGRGAAPERVRAIAPAGWLIGRSVHSAEEALAIERAGGCDYLIFGSVFETESKPAGHPAAGLETLARVCAAVALPVIAIGGIVAARAREIADAGAAGVAGIGMFASGDEDVLRSRIREIEDAFAAG